MDLEKRVSDLEKKLFWLEIKCNNLQDRIDKLKYTPYVETKRKVRKTEMKKYEPIENENWMEFNKSLKVSDLGRVLKNDKILIIMPEATGYVKYSKYAIHRLVAMCFIPNPDNKPTVDHIDTNRANNKKENLRWVWNVENLLYNDLTYERLKNMSGNFLVTSVFKAYAEDKKYAKENNLTIKYNDITIKRLEESSIDLQL